MTFEEAKQRVYGSVIDIKTGKIEKVLKYNYGSKEGSYLVSQSKVTPQGIDCAQHFTESEFTKRFECKNHKNNGSNS